MSNWESAAITAAADAVREAMQENLRSEYNLTKALSKLKSALDDGEFVRFVMDCERGLGLSSSTALKFERMIGAFDVVPAEKVWEKIGWSGVSRVVKITTRNERVAVCRAVTREPGTVSKTRLNEILSDKAPSYSLQSGRRNPIGPMSKTQALRERGILADTLNRLLQEYAVLRRQIPEEVAVILGLNDQSESRAG